MPGHRLLSGVADWKGSEFLASAPKPFHLGPGVRRDERISWRMCREAPHQPAGLHRLARPRRPGAGASPKTSEVPSPADVYAELFHQVQMRKLFADGKTFVDAKPRRPPARILADYRAHAAFTDAELKRFVRANFVVPEDAPAPPPSKDRTTLKAHIAALWPVLTRPPVQAVEGDSALPLDKPFVVPGGRFREIYYWDSYFTMLGLAADGRQDAVENMVDDFGGLIDRYGHIPNGARTYYLSRSQPPFLLRDGGPCPEGGGRQDRQGAVQAAPGPDAPRARLLDGRREGPGAGPGLSPGGRPARRRDPQPLRRRPLHAARRVLPGGRADGARGHPAVRPATSSATCARAPKAAGTTARAGWPTARA